MGVANVDLLITDAIPFRSIRFAPFSTSDKYYKYNLFRIIVHAYNF